MIQLKIALRMGLLNDQFVGKAVRNGRLALQVIQSISPGLMLNNIMAKKDGFELCSVPKGNEAISAILGWKNAGVAIYSALAL